MSIASSYRKLSEDRSGPENSAFCVLSHEVLISARLLPPTTHTYRKHRVAGATITISESATVHSSTLAFIRSPIKIHNTVPILDSFLLCHQTKRTPRILF